MSNQSQHDLSDDERAELTPQERKAVDAFIAAAKALPRSIYIDVPSWPDDGDFHLIVGKRLTSSRGRHVARLKKRSLVFG
jgi:hypothetical protein